MKEIKIIISDRVLRELKTAHTVKSITGNLSGINDEFVNKIIKSLDEDKDEVIFQFKDEKEEN